MIFTKQQVFNSCKVIASKYNFEPELIQALCLQEGGKHKSGDFAPDRARLEQNYYIRYVEQKHNLATTSEILLAASYGVTQMMGLSLKEVGFFDWYFSKQDEKHRTLLGSAYSQFAIPNALDWYCEDLDSQIDWGCQWLDRKRKLANGNTIRMLGLWNGDLSGKYASEVISKYNGLKK